MKPYALEHDEALVRELVASRPDMTLDELHDELGRRGCWSLLNRPLSSGARADA